MTRNTEHAYRSHLRWICGTLLALWLIGCATSPQDFDRQRDWDYALAAICQQHGHYFVGYGKEIRELYRRGLTPEAAYNKLLEGEKQ